MPSEGLALAVLLPALAAAAAVLVLADGSKEAPASDTVGAPARLAKLAELGAQLTPAPDPRRTVRALRPVVAERGRAGIEPSPLEPLAGGIRPAPPERIAIPAAGLDAVVEPVGTHAGAIEVPDVGRAGWYDAGPRPGERGRAVVIGHLDTHTGPGLFARVPRLPPGTAIAVTDRRGEVHSFNVIGGAQVEKARFPGEYVYGGSDAPTLILITCGGPYRPGRGYRDNVLLYARAG